jgi:hypothetical protein
MRVFAATAVEHDARPGAEPEFFGIEPVLAGENQAWHNTPDGEGAGDRFQFDGFRSGADDQPDVRGFQSSP